MLYVSKVLLESKALLSNKFLHTNHNEHIKIQTDVKSNSFNYAWNLAIFIDIFDMLFIFLALSF